MNRPVVFRPEAEEDTSSAWSWYESQREGLGAEFSAALDEFIARIESMPELYAVILDNVRRGNLRRFPYVVYYRPLEKCIEVLGVLHGRRDPTVWQDRI